MTVSLSNRGDHIAQACMEQTHCFHHSDELRSSTTEARKELAQFVASHLKIILVASYIPLSVCEPDMATLIHQLVTRLRAWANNRRGAERYETEVEAQIDARLLLSISLPHAEEKPGALVR